jgi:hypothetical protein
MFCCETQISKTKCLEICKTNNPATSGGYNTPPFGAELESRACPGVHTRDVSCCWIRRCRQYTETLFLLFLMMTTIFMMPRNVWGEQYYQYTDKEGTIVITDKPPPEEDIKSDTKNSNSFQDSAPEDRLHWGRDNALIDKQNKGENRQRKTFGNVDAGKYEVKVKKIGSNLYQDISTRVIIKTIACVEPAGGDESLLDWSGSIGELYFKKTSKSCMVKKVYK